ncbi:MAG: XisI protein [Bernardetiaceae bacterium]|nr:XisI protein [Bernardetiaceae bacterium]
MSALAASGGLEPLLSIDRGRGQYILMADGWEGTERRYAPLAHVELRPDGQVWLRCDNTDLEIGQRLIDVGIQAKDIVPAFFSPQLRQFARRA